MACKQCGKWMYFKSDYCSKRCADKVRKFHTLKAHYNRLKSYNLRWAVLNCRRAGFSLRKIAEILGRDVDTIENTWDIILQDAR